MTEYAAFLLVAVVTCAVPGPDTLMVLRTALVNGQRAGTWVAAGSATGNVLWGAASVVGVATLLATSATAFSVVKLAGALYLAYLGVMALRAAYRNNSSVADATDAEPMRPGTAFRRGLMCDLANVKVGLFWTALVPQFMSAGAAMPFAMVASMGLLVFAWLAVYAAGAARMKGALKRRERALNATTGAMFVALAAKLARAEA